MKALHNLAPFIWKHEPIQQYWSKVWYALSREVFELKDRTINVESDQLFTIRQVLENAGNWTSMSIKYLFTYDSIDRIVLYKLMLHFGIATKLGSVINVTMFYTIAQVRINNSQKDIFELNVGLNQGD